MLKRNKVKKVIALLTVVILSMYHSMSSYAAIAYTVSVPVVEDVSTTTKIIIKISGTVTASETTWLLMSHYLTYTKRGGSIVEKVKQTHGSTSMRTKMVTGTSTFACNVGEHRTYIKAYNEGFKGITSSEIVSVGYEYVNMQ